MLFFNHLKSTFRHLLKNRLFFAVSLGGLSIGLAAFILISLYVHHEFNWDSSHVHRDIIYRVEQDIEKNDRRERVTKTPFPLGPGLVDEFAEVKGMVRLHICWEVTLSSGRKRTFKEVGGVNSFITGFYADESLFTVFTIPFVEGNPGAALAEPYTIVLTQSMAEKYYPGESPLGKTLEYDQRFPCKVTGVIADPPANSHFKYKYFISMKTLETERRESALIHDWEETPVFTYLLLSGRRAAASLTPRIENYLENRDLRHTHRLRLNPLNRIHFSLTEFELQDNTNIMISYQFAAVAILILIVAFLNFMNLNTAASLARSKEIGVKKVTGASRAILARHFLGECLMLSLLALGIGFILADLFLPVFNLIVNRDLHLHPFDNWGLAVLILFATLAVGLLSGLYPAFRLSGIRPARIFRGTAKPGDKSSAFNRLLLVFQFLVAMVLMGATLIVIRQIQFVQSKDLGFDPEHILVNQFNRLSSQELDRYRVLKRELLNTPLVSHASISSQTVMFGYEWDDFHIEGSGPDEKTRMIFNRVDHDFLDTYRIDIQDGRGFREDFATDRDEACIINETARRRFGWQAAIGKRIFWGDRPYTVIGVVKDFHYFTLYWKIQPYIMVMARDRLGGNNVLSMKIKGGDLEQTRARIQDRFRTFFPDKIIELRQISEFADRSYQDILTQVARTIGFFSLLTILIAAMGLFSMVSFSTIRRTKEIGIRKVLGATAWEIFLLMIREFFRLFVVALLFAWPLIYILKVRVMKEFPYHIGFRLDIYLFTAAVSLLIVLVSVGYKSLRAATANPVESLRYE